MSRAGELMLMNFKELLDLDKEIVENHIKNHFPKAISYEKKLLDSMLYSLNAGGKRLRPTLFLETIRLFKKNIYDFVDIACALEMIHTYSLIHDDLPAMDNDDLRRGKPTNHIVFGEAIAILAGDALLNYANELMLKFLIKNNDVNYVKGVYEISKASGINGMIAGQIVDIESEGLDIDFKTMEFIHSYKTGALIDASVMSAAIMAKASDRELLALKSYAKNIGLAFQITDDILDIEGDSAILGKNIGSDQIQDKATYPKFYGIEKSKIISKELVDEAINYLEIFNSNDKMFFVELAYFILKRQK